MGKVWCPGVGRFGPQEQTHDGTVAGLIEDKFGERWKHSPKVLECQGKRVQTWSWAQHEAIVCKLVTQVGGMFWEKTNNMEVVQMNYKHHSLCPQMK